METYQNNPKNTCILVRLNVLYNKKKQIYTWKYFVFFISNPCHFPSPFDFQLDNIFKVTNRN